jgi:hypothetical protein
MKATGVTQRRHLDSLRRRPVAGPQIKVRNASEKHPIVIQTHCKQLNCSKEFEVSITLLQHTVRN